MEKAYTHGPWVIRNRFPEGDFNAQIIAPGKLSDGNNAIVVDQIHFQPDAKLISAAPDLLEALEDLYMSVYAGNSVSLKDAMNRSVKTDEFEQKIVRAIRKARGI